MYKGERFNSISHLIGAAAALIGCIVLVVQAINQGDARKIVCFGVYGSTLVLFYSISVLYHSLRGKAKQVFRKLDHYSIYLLIAGTYTPFTLITLRGEVGWSIFSIIWGMAIFGIVLDSLPHTGPRIVPVILYLFMGWLIVIALEPLMQLLPSAGFTWLLIGGILYTFGVFFYAFGNNVRYFHGIWHLFVIGGSSTHYFVVLFYVI